MSNLVDEKYFRLLCKGAGLWKPRTEKQYINKILAETRADRAAGLDGAAETAQNGDAVEFWAMDLEDQIASVKQQSRKSGEGAQKLDLAKKYRQILKRRVNNVDYVDLPSYYKKPFVPSPKNSKMRKAGNNG